ncbi:MAG: sensor histidine kinase [Actinomycetota bacterium]
MIETMLRPWRQASTWWGLVYTLVGILVGAVTFSVTFSLLVTTVSLLIVFPLAIPVAWLLFFLARALGRLERSRASALLGVEIADPHEQLEGSWWSKLMKAARTKSRWREIGYLIALLPVAALAFSATLVAWCGSAALAALPTYVWALPGNAAKFGLFEVSSGVGLAIVTLMGLVGLVVIAPWVTVGVAATETSLARRLLGPPPGEELSRKVRQLEVSRTAAVDSAEAERRRIERDLHDGAQQRLVSLAMDLGQAAEKFDTDLDTAKELVVGAHQEAKAALSDLRGLVRGIHPAILEDRGLDPALSAVVARSPVPVTLKVDVSERPAPAIESTAYFVVAEALTNVAKHAQATKAAVTIARQGDRLVVEVTDDGIGCADPATGTGLRGLSERVAAVGGWMTVLSPSGGPTTVMVELPCGS